MSKNDGGPAFPHTPDNSPRMNGEGGKGMSLRQYAMIHAPANLSEVLTFKGEDLVGRPSPEAAGDIGTMKGLERQEALATLRSQRAQWHLELEIKLREKWADAVIAAGEVVE